MRWQGWLMAAGALALCACGGGNTEDASGALQQELRQHWTLTLTNTSGGWVMNAPGDVVGDGYYWDRSSQTAIPLGYLGTGDDTVPRDLNARGQVVGMATIQPGHPLVHAFFWEDGVIEDLGALNDDYPQAKALAISPSGEIVGIGAADTHGPGEHYTRALYWDRKNHQLSELTGLEPDPISEAVDINPSGTIVGTSSGPDGTYHPVIWKKGVPQDLGLFTPPGDDFEFPVHGVAINASGDVVGEVRGGLMEHQWILVRQRNGSGWVDVGNFGGGGTNVKDKRCLNASGQVAGWSRDADGNVHGFFWDGATLHDVGGFGGTWTSAYAVNDSGHVVGTSYDADDVSHGFMWYQGELIDLSDLVDLPDGWWISSAEFITNDGAIMVGVAPDHGTAVLRPSAH